jgi:hypothetical protein
MGGELPVCFHSAGARSGRSGDELVAWERTGGFGSRDKADGTGPRARPPCCIAV